MPIATPAEDVEETSEPPGRRLGGPLIAAMVVAALLIIAGIVILIMLLNRQQRTVAPATLAKSDTQRHPVAHAERQHQSERSSNPQSDAD